MKISILIFLQLTLLIDTFYTKSLEPGNKVDESDKISIIMETMLPSMFGLFSNITDSSFKANFQEPCTFEKLLEIFSQLPPYFDQIAKKFPTKPDLVAYYSMQLASTFLVNNGSLSMKCLYNMLSLQTRLQNFSLDLMDNPEKNMPLVGVFGVFMKPIMSRLKQNAMMKIIEHVDKYEKNDDLSTIAVFNFLNTIFCSFGLIAILANVFLIILLKRTGNRPVKLAQNKKTKIYKPLPAPATKPLKTRSNLKSKYKQVKNRNFYLNQLIRKKYKTRFCFILIAACHAAYILLNYIVMSQAGLASVALKGLTQLNLACKMAFFLMPPTTAYNILHQLAVWLLVYAVRKHAIKLRQTKTHNFDENADYDVDIMNMDFTDEEEDNYAFERNLYDDSDTMAKANVQFNTERSLVPYNPSGFNSTYHTYRVPKSVQKVHKSSSPGLFSRKRRNLQFSLLVLVFLFIYNSQNIFLYSLNVLKTPHSNIYFCAFEEHYSEFYSVLNQYIVPLLNLSLFSLIPILLCTIQILFDICFLVRVKREQMKRYMKLKEIIEWPVYAYFGVFLLSQLPFSLHQVYDLIAGSVKFPFVFPLFIQMKFTNKIILVVLEQSLLFLACGSDLIIWLVCDKHLRELAMYWLNKRILCRTYSDKEDIESKSSSGDSSVINDDSIKSQVTQSQSNGIPNGYESSTLTSTSSSTNKKSSFHCILLII